ncbi:hypothetical protein SAMN04489730_3592 [Amycolatopsis australiensis]|uniref:HpcH/HpaI aldolase/citrate lyase domain-containing protein n=1 Tax=Amycolatopsis australiensis TaxID=546364 RepID=A0A1K1RMI1_9PSEU|nr:hypothetical protein SAMN04489730_3592 [Amycolatopsis australiensis]
MDTKTASVGRATSASTSAGRVSVGCRCDAWTKRCPRSATRQRPVGLGGRPPPARCEVRRAGRPARCRQPLPNGAAPRPFHSCDRRRRNGRPAPLDGVTTTLDDTGALRADLAHAVELGFTGKLCIHPRQVAPVNETFTPTETELRWAKGVVPRSVTGRSASTMVSGSTAPSSCTLEPSRPGQSWPEKRVRAVGFVPIRRLAIRTAATLSPGDRYPALLSPAGRWSQPVGDRGRPLASRDAKLSARPSSDRHKRPGRWRSSVVREFAWDSCRSSPTRIRSAASCARSAAALFPYRRAICGVVQPLRSMRSPSLPPAFRK